MTSLINEITVSAEVTDCYSNAKSTIDCDLSLVKNNNNELSICASAEGSFTGFESFNVDAFLLHGYPNGWLACAGRRGEYDTLYISQSEIERALKSLGLV